MVIWAWEPADQTWEARELPLATCAKLTTEAAVMARPGGRALLLAGSGVSINGLPALPLCSLAHLDEVRAGGQVFVVSAESRHEPTPLPVRRDGDACARCKARLAAGEPAIICCACDSPHHPDCFHFDPKCGGCAASTEGISWIPGGRP
jgi:hypothetical protein